ncbi:unnamed protein product [Cladocopium goreaui]|uniref:Uncharacterized protein n=1 Tax=Cladocopium goreaui TaxID=2562237 RepID=A0A9P1DJ79_9DINO|nr:unnamed protein product [Cladocopium goreaui]
MAQAPETSGSSTIPGDSDPDTATLSHVEALRELQDFVQSRQYSRIALKKLGVQITSHDRDSSPWVDEGRCLIREVHAHAHDAWSTARPQMGAVPHLGFTGSGEFMFVVVIFIVVFTVCSSAFLFLHVFAATGSAMCGGFGLNFSLSVGPWVAVRTIHSGSGTR